MGLIATPFSKRRELPVAPQPIADAVEEFARKSGRHATLEFVPLAVRGNRVGGTWVARFSLKSSDKRMKLYLESRVGEPPTEDVWFHIPNPKSRDMNQPDYISFNIHQMGVSGVKNFLERGDTWSGRGEFKSIVEQARLSRLANDALKKKFRAEQKEANRYEQRDLRRHRFKIPVVPVGIDLSKQGE